LAGANASLENSRRAAALQKARRPAKKPNELMKENERLMSEQSCHNNYLFPSDWPTIKLHIMGMQALQLFTSFSTKE